jgi:cysteinylglycine-S-conjugate dipeptidase
MKNVLKTFEERFQTHLEDLKTLVRIPSISFPGFDHSQVEKSADNVALLMRNIGLKNIEQLRVNDSFPYVYGEYISSPDKPTVLLYAHHDVQPVGREELWRTSPFEPIEKEGPGGLRLFARGSADDKAGIFVHLAAIDSYLKSGNELPVNVKVIIEGEEEIGSPNLDKFLNQYQSLLAADYIILTDTANFDCGYPSLTIALRGMAIIDVEVRALNKSIHSGFWGGLVPDPAMALSKAIATLMDDQGKITIPGINELVQPLTENEKTFIQSTPFQEARFKEQSGMVDSAQVLNNTDYPMAELWRYPSLTVNGIQASSREQAGSIINDVAWSKLSIRIPPGIDANKVMDLFCDELQKNIPWGLETKINREAACEGWQTDPYGEHAETFAKAKKALEKGYDHESIFIGCGATIPFVRPFAEALKNAPALLIGIEDPYTNAHGENESLLISDFKKACLSEIYLLEALSGSK